MASPVFMVEEEQKRRLQKPGSGSVQILVELKTAACPVMPFIGGGWLDYSCWRELQDGRHLAALLGT
jgi:hypothetical protein